MSVISCRTKAATPEGGAKVESDESGATVVYRASAEFVVRTNDEADGPFVVIDYFNASTEWPGLGDPYTFGNDPSPSGLYCTGIDPRRDAGDPTLWFVRHTFGDPEKETQKPDDDGKPTTNPLNWRPEVEVDFIDRMIPAVDALYLSGFTGAANLKWSGFNEGLPWNSAGVAFDPPVEREDFIRVIRITKFLAEYDEAVWDAYENVVNSAAFTFNRPHIAYKGSWPAYTARIPRVQGSLSFENQVTHWRVTIPIIVDKRNTWHSYILDRGYCARAEAGDPTGRGGTIPQEAIAAGMAPYRVLTDFDGVPFPTPVPLDGDGAALTPGDPFVYLRYQLYPHEVDFSTLSELTF